MKVYIGYDSTNYGQEVAYRVCKRSIENYNSRVEIHPIKLRDLRAAGIFNRPHDEKQSTEFTYTRFLTPFLNKYDEKALFCDSDFLWRCNVEDVLQFMKDDQSVSCVQHKYTACPSEIKMDGLKQEWYPRKNWSSLMLFNASHNDCKKLTKQVINTESPRYLHRMEWTTDEMIGSIPLTYNHLVGYYVNSDPKAVHFTDGGPWHKDTMNVEFGDEWLSYLTNEEEVHYSHGMCWT